MKRDAVHHSFLLRPFDFPQLQLCGPDSINFSLGILQLSDSFDFFDKPQQMVIQIIG